MNTLKRTRLLKEVSQGKLADATGLSRQVISNLERGTSRGYPETWQRIAKELDVTVDELLDAPKVQPPRERLSEPPVGGSLLGEPRSLEERHLLVRGWEVILEDLGERYQKAVKELRDPDLNFFPEEASKVAVLTTYQLRFLSREAAEIREAPSVIAAVEKIQSARVSVERMLNQRFEVLDDAHAREINRFLSMEKNEPMSGEDRAHNAN